MPDSHYPFVTALCPTFRHPELLANSVALWLMQDYPLERRELVILDDAQTFHAQAGIGWRLVSDPQRMPSLPAKYNRLLLLARTETQAFLVWEDDDVYLPRYVWSHVRALSESGALLSKPSRVLSDYTRSILGEDAGGRFHSSLAFCRELIEQIGGWPETQRADFDQQLIARLTDAARGRVTDPAAGVADRDLQYVMGWHTQAAHCQSTMRSPSDETWYERAEQSYRKVPFVGALRPQYDARTRRILEQLQWPVT